MELDKKKLIEEMKEKNLAVAVRGLKTYFALDEGTLKAVDGIDVDIPRGKTIGIIGESGSGKSVFTQSVLKIVPTPGKIVDGSILVDSGKNGIVEVADIPNRDKMLRTIRGKDISIIFQEPMTSLSPVHTVGNQIMEAIKLHRAEDAERAREITLELLEQVGISNTQQRVDEYPFQLSGGMRQRVMIAMALSCNPNVVLADEPTTALDVTVQAQILELMANLQKKHNMALVYISHDLGVIAEVAQEVYVMYLGRIVERASTKELFKNPMHPYTQGLMESIPSISSKKRRLNPISGNVPTPIDPPMRCGFYGRCAKAIDGKCDCRIPKLIDIKDGHFVRCFRIHGEEEEKV